MSDWDTYPDSYRQQEVNAIVETARSGGSALVVGLSGSGKSNLLAFLAYRWPQIAAGQESGVDFVLVDGNRLPDATADAFLTAMSSALVAGALELFAAVESYLAGSQRVLCFLLDRTERLRADKQEKLWNNLRALRDTHKYRLCYVLARRAELQPDNEFAELFFGNTLWLGPLSEADTLWNIARFQQRVKQGWPQEDIQAIASLSGGYPSLVKALCEVKAQSGAMDYEAVSMHPAVRRRIEEFWADAPTEEMLRRSVLDGHRLLKSGQVAALDTAELTAKEHALLSYLQAHPGEVCEKHILIEAVWPEDKVYEAGIRDDSLAQLVRRLRGKIEPDPGEPRYILTVPGRGYRFIPD
jgi:hypothetical protein